MSLVRNRSLVNWFYTHPTKHLFHLKCVKILFILIYVKHSIINSINVLAKGLIIYRLILGDTTNANKSIRLSVDFAFQASQQTYNCYILIF